MGRAAQDRARSDHAQGAFAAFAGVERPGRGDEGQPERRQHQARRQAKIVRPDPAQQRFGPDRNGDQHGGRPAKLRSGAKSAARKGCEPLVAARQADAGRADEDGGVQREIECNAQGEARGCVVFPTQLIGDPSLMAVSDFSRKTCDYVAVRASVAWVTPALPIAPGVTSETRRYSAGLDKGGRADRASHWRAPPKERARPPRSDRLAADRCAGSRDGLRAPP